jgi:hypothetical protein
MSDPPHAHPRQPCVLPEWRVGDRRLDIRLPGRRQRRFRIPAAMDLQKRRLGQLDGIELEHVIHRGRPPADWRMARSSLVQDRPDSSRTRRHRLRPFRRTLPGVPGRLERQRRQSLLLSIRDSVRSPRSGELHQRAGDKRMGFLQSERRRYEARSLGTGHLQCFPASRRGADQGHRGSRQPRCQVPPHDYSSSGQQRRDQQRHQQYGRGHRNHPAGRSQSHELPVAGTVSLAGLHALDDWRESTSAGDAA